MYLTGVETVLPGNGSDAGHKNCDDFIVSKKKFEELNKQSQFYYMLKI